MPPDFPLVTGALGKSCGWELITFSAVGKAQGAWIVTCMIRVCKKSPGSVEMTGKHLSLAFLFN